MPADIYWIGDVGTGRLAILGRPRPGDWLEDEIGDWRRQGIDVAVSLLEPSEASTLGLDEEPTLCQRNEITFVSFPIPDFGVPTSLDLFVELIRSIRSHLVAGRIVGVHCRGGVGRSAIVAACTLVAAGLAAGEALQRIALARRVEVPETDEQRNFIHGFRPISPM